ncbi:ORF78 [Cydia pomonella granulovirus]|uniref:ORF78 n=2 Tax=Cydia pomonella granulosis virus TaxID=28289 RepID=Q91EX7_GVCPM|nr:ORF78 [Cydia pomonella granulovirus]AAK70738.1 ORF78 [Cydia pomonella granulovirus]AIU36724.1 ORF78 [Cydia pomonella granulovirus]AIU37003.1 ORF78 [Cydia pomonella granulovirus]AIU37145.1 ORF78 [Cydia pomonella granulovirus]QDW81137.1 ORF78 [Cydia pomonella granulovirus]
MIDFNKILYIITLCIITPFNFTQHTSYKTPVYTLVATTKASSYPPRYLPPHTHPLRIYNTHRTPYLHHYCTGTAY